MPATSTPTTVLADPQNPVITTFEEAEAAWIAWVLDATPAEMQALADAHGVDARRRLESGELVRAELPHSAR